MRSPSSLSIIAGLFTLTGTMIRALLLAVVLLVVSADVFARLFLATSLHIAHDLAIVALAALVWLGVVGAARDRELFGIRFFTDRLPARWQRPVGILVDLLVIAIAAEVARSALIQVQTARFTRFLALGWPKWIVSAVLAGAMVALILAQIAHLWTLIRNRKTDA